MSREVGELEDSYVQVRREGVAKGGAFQGVMRRPQKLTCYKCREGHRAAHCRKEVAK